MIGPTFARRVFLVAGLYGIVALGVFAKHVVHPERSEKNGVATQPFQSEEAPDEAPS